MSSLSFISFVENILCEDQPMISKISADMSHFHVKRFLNPEAMSKHPLVLGKEHEGLPAGTKVKGESTFIKDGRYHVKATHLETGKRYDIPIHKLNKPAVGRATLNQEAAENEHIAHLHSQIQSELKSTGKPEIPLKFMGETHQIAGAMKIPQIEGRPKADMTLVNSKGERKVFISHKKSANPARILRYGGISDFEKSGLNTVSEFKQRLSKHINPKVGIRDTPEDQAAHKGKRYTMKLDMNNPEHVHIAKHSMFGPRYQESEHNVNNIHAILYGQMNLHKHSEGHYTISSDKQTNHDSSFNPIEHPVHIEAHKEMGARGKANRDFKNVVFSVQPSHEEKGTTYV